MKRLKDPIYGYIEIDDSVFTDFIDTPAFQRLRRIVQTSYGPLYPAASHNRFVHSLGVYYLGCYAAEAVRSSVEQLIETDREFSVKPHVLREKLEVFKKACLLHDLGHAPFSHSGEQFYDVVTDSRALDERMTDAVADPDFTETVKEMGNREAAPHERMSVIVGIDLFGDLIADKTLFARCITGYAYDDESALDAEYQLDNILVSLLNSSTIDVDKLDYLIRDSFVVGFESTSIDYERLLEGIEVKRIAKNKYGLVYHRSAISVLENVVYARDFEKKWIQSHPIIIYDQFLLQNAMRFVNNKLCAKEPGKEKKDKSENDSCKTLFCEKALSVQGDDYPGDIHISLLCDDDVVFLAKNRFPNSYIDEYFDRKNRRHPIWKSASEFRAYFGEERNKEPFRQLTNILHELGNGEGSQQENSLILDSKLAEKIRSEIDGLDKQDDSASDSRRRYLNDHLEFLNGLEEICVKNAIAFDFALIFTKSFTSGFNPDAFKRTKIDFPNKDKDRILDLEAVSSCLSGEEIDRSELFYLYHKHAALDDFPRDSIVQYLKESQE